MLKSARNFLVIFFAGIVLTACGGGTSVPPGPATSSIPAAQLPAPLPASQVCATAVQTEFAACTQIASASLGECFAAGGTDCDDIDSNDAITQALFDMELAISDSCTVAAASEAGFPIGPLEIAEQLEDQCVGVSQTLANRVFGGPQNAVFTSADVQASAVDSACLTNAYDEATAFIDSARGAYQACLEAGDCSGVQAEIDTLFTVSQDAVAAMCTESSLTDLVGITPARLMDRSLNDVQCQVSASNADLGDLSLDCQPSQVVDAISAYEFSTGSAVEIFPSTASTDGSPSEITEFTAERGQFVQIELDAEETGAMCGDGSNYRFWMQLAPEGFPLDDVLIFMQGGGACTLADCGPAILAAMDFANGVGDGSTLTNNFNDGVGAAAGGFNSPASVFNDDNPYQNFTKIHLTYCTQEIFSGGEGGAQTVNVTPPGSDPVDFVISRTGGHNARESIKYARNVIWAAMNAEGDSYDPSVFDVMFTGSSAGGFGATYNYHFALDEMRWTNTAVANLWGFGLDDLGDAGQGLQLLFGFLGPLWNISETLAPFCQDATCVHAEVQAQQSLLRLDPLRFPRQAYLMASAQIDFVQSATTGFGSDVAGFENWGNALRATYCRMRDPANIPSQENLHFFLPSTFEHVLSVTTPFAPQNISYLDWLGDFETALSVADNVDTVNSTIEVTDGNMVTLAPFTCSP